MYSIYRVINFVNMSTPCVVCKSAVTKVRAPGLQCTGSCKLFFHFDCATITADEIDMIEKKSLEWRCKSCKKGRQSLVFPRNDSLSGDSPITKSNKNNEKQEFKILQDNQEAMKKNLQELKDMMNAINKKLDDFIKSNEPKETNNGELEQLIGAVNEISKNVNVNLLETKKVADSQNENINQNENNNNNKLINELVAKVDKISKTVNKKGHEINKVRTESVSSTYADKVKLRTPVSNKQFMLLKPKDINQSSSITRDELKKHIDPVDFAINNMRTISKGGIIVECESKEVAEQLRKSTENKLGTDYEVVSPNAINPRIKILGISEKLDNDQILSYLVKQNQFIEEKDVIKVLKLEESKNNNRNYKKFNLIIEVDNETYSKCMKVGKINIKWDRCRIVEAVQLIRCFNCSGFNHIADNCNRKKACPKCAEEHLITDCKSEDEKCANCISVNQNLKLNLDIDHPGWSHQCPVYQRKIEFKKQKINYAE